MEKVSTGEVFGYSEGILEDFGEEKKLIST